MDNFLAIVVQICMVVLALTTHEFSHAMAAYKLGDDTAKRMGRLTLNPLKHLDILGAIMLLIVKIGWAKPVPINPYNFKNQKTGMAITAAAGPASNGVLAIIAAMFYNFSINSFSALGPSSLFLSSLRFLVMINLVLGLFNMIPIPPFDGSKIIGGFMPDDMYFKWRDIDIRHGRSIMMGIILVNLIYPIIPKIIMPPLNFFMQLLLG